MVTTRSPLLQSAEDFPDIVPCPAKDQAPRLVLALTFDDVDERFPTRREHGAAGHGEHGFGFDVDATVGVKFVEQFVAMLARVGAHGVFEHHAHLGRAGFHDDVWVNEGHGGREDLSGDARSGDFHGLPDANPCEVALVSVEDKPHLREIADFEEHIAFFYVLALVDFALDDGTGDGRHDVEGVAV